MQLQNEFLSITRILLCILFLQPSRTAPSPPSSPSSLPSTNLTSTNGASNGRCAYRNTFPAWYATNWLIEDCYAAVQQLYLRETMLHPNQEYEFLQQGFSPHDPQFPAQKTPRKYTVGKLLSPFLIFPHPRISSLVVQAPAP